MEVIRPMRLDKARPLIVVDNTYRCGHCLSLKVEWAELETVHYRDHMGGKVIIEPGYFCLDCEQISLPNKSDEAMEMRP